MTLRRWACGVACVTVVAACSGGHQDSSPPPPSDQTVVPAAADGGVDVPPGGQPDAGPPARVVAAPVTQGDWAFYSTDQGLSPRVNDASADEAGNVYVAAHDALYAKARDAQDFLRFDASNAGFTKNCYDVGVTPEQNAAAFSAALSGKAHPTPPGPAIQCPIVSVGGAAPGVAGIGFQGLGTDNDNDGDWAIDSGGMDVVKFDPATSTMARTRHVLIASPPHYICAATGAESLGATSCPDVTDPMWTKGRRKTRQVLRIVANHDPNDAKYGDFWMGGTHATFTALINNAEKRGWIDITAGQTDPKWADAKFVWEHDHPGVAGLNNASFLTGFGFALSIDPRNGTVWGSNTLRTGFMMGYGANVKSKIWWIAPVPADPAAKPWYDFWPDVGDPLGPTSDNILSMSHCPDGALWIASYTHGLVRLDTAGGISYVDLPNPAQFGHSAKAVACDPSDGSVWIGLGFGGLMRLKDGAFTTLSTTGLPAFLNQPVKSIQIDRWASPRIVYVAFEASVNPDGSVKRSGGLGVYKGP
jgi:hypothetical protein